jgi:hypothetical protein
MARPAGLSRSQQRALARLSTIRGMDRFHLAGGTAIAIHLHHRRSEDLDLFGPARASFAPFEAAARTSPSELQVVRAGEATLHLEVGGVPVDVVRYPYALLEPAEPGPGGIRVAGLLDLATNKLAAISKRGLRRDFWDLYEITRRGPSLEEALAAYVRRFAVAKGDLYHVLTALTWFDDAEADRVLPRGMTPALWKRIRAYFEREAPRRVFEP